MDSCKGIFAPFLLLFLLFCAGCSFPGGEALGGPSPPPSGSLSVSFIDVGQGDGVLVQAGGTSHLIDAGRPEEGPEVVDFLRARGVKSLDGIVVSNPDADHIGGFLDVLDAFEVEAVYLSGDDKGTLTYNAFLRAVDDEGSEVRVVRAGMLMDWGGVRADAWVQKHPALGAAIPRHTQQGRTLELSLRRDIDCFVGDVIQVWCSPASRSGTFSFMSLAESRGTACCW